MTKDMAGELGELSVYFTGDAVLVLEVPFLALGNRGNEFTHAIGSSLLAENGGTVYATSLLIAHDMEFGPQQAEYSTPEQKDVQRRNYRSSPLIDYLQYLYRGYIAHDEQEKRVVSMGELCFATPEASHAYLIDHGIVVDGAPGEPPILEVRIDPK